MSQKETIVSQQDRNLKWKAFDVLERILMILCGVAIAGFTLGVFLDVVTRSIGHPWLWLQEVTLGFFVYGIFLGASVAVRRNEHVILANTTENLRGASRVLLETFNRLVVLGVALSLLYFGYINFLHGFQSYLMPSMTPIAVLTVILPISGVLISLFTIEQLINGWKKGFHTHSMFEENKSDEEEMTG
ncbi:TRAP transporter small permease [Halalkalibacter oceani]|uniref:TRAP transporter small permease subunit n=1 Tax=Halalkalibacter oceani TaxID=1653776 RepID=A0A9X2DMG1_9BACI|nr:TRAP transporter small permease subunit [Halalkalibacter oceani]MCM3713499.1 TRAP transporter small permease subunit [Halalkalibacter oceani]MCM3761321.1 TRAP transporter small permease subunit [Halalkalibacter oceani]